MLFENKLFEMGLNAKDRLLNKQVKEFRELLGKIAQERIDEENQCEINRTQSNKFDLIYYLKQANLLSQLSKDDIISEFCTFYVAGSDTSGSFSAMFIFYLT